MSDSWDVYITEMEGAPASIAIDMGITPEPPQKYRSYLHVVLVQLLSPTETGMTTNEEAEVLFRMEDALAEHFSTALGAIFVARITGSGDRQFFYYASVKEGLEAALGKVMRDFPDYEASSITKEDPGWQFFLQIVPQEEQSQQIKNQKVLALMHEQGDYGEAPRPVDHFVYFRDKMDREKFVKTVRDAGFELKDMTEHPDSEEPWGVIVSATQTASHEEIHQAVDKVSKLAKSHGGNYDGWETQIV